MNPLDKTPSQSPKKLPNNPELVSNLDRNLDPAFQDDKAFFHINEKLLDNFCDLNPNCPFSPKDLKDASKTYPGVVMRYIMATKNGQNLNGPKLELQLAINEQAKPVEKTFFGKKQFIENFEDKKNTEFKNEFLIGEYITKSGTKCNCQFKDGSYQVKITRVNGNTEKLNYPKEGEPTRKITFATPEKSLSTLEEKAEAKLEEELELKKNPGHSLFSRWKIPKALRAYGKRKTLTEKHYNWLYDICKKKYMRALKEGNPPPSAEEMKQFIKIEYENRAIGKNYKKGLGFIKVKPITMLWGWKTERHHIRFFDITVKKKTYKKIKNICKEAYKVAEEKGITANREYFRQAVKEAIAWEEAEKFINDDDEEIEGTFWFNKITVVSYDDSPAVNKARKICKELYDERKKNNEKAPTIEEFSDAINKYFMGEKRFRAQKNFNEIRSDNFKYLEKDKQIQLLKELLRIITFPTLNGTKKKGIYIGDKTLSLVNNTLLEDLKILQKSKDFPQKNETDQLDILIKIMNICIHPQQDFSGKANPKPIPPPPSMSDQDPTTPIPQPTEFPSSNKDKEKVDDATMYGNPLFRQEDTEAEKIIQDLEKGTIPEQLDLHGKSPPSVYHTVLAACKRCYDDAIAKNSVPTLEDLQRAVDRVLRYSPS